MQPYVPVLALGFAGVAAACAESPMAPLAPPPDGAPLAAKTVGSSKGGASYIESQRNVADTTLTVPPNALPVSSMTITVTALPGKLVAYDFQPHGTRFRSAIKVRQELANTTWAGNSGRMTLEGGYFADRTQVDFVNATAKLNETFPITISGTTASFWTPHFSGYLVASGRRTYYY